MNAAPSTMPNPYSGEIVDGAPYKLNGECVWGRGACEQKGSLAAMIAAIRFLGASKIELPSDLYLIVSTAGETGRHDSLAYVLDHGRVEADWCIIDGPPEIQLGNKGRIDVLVIVRGKQSHSSRPWEGINAIEGAMKVLGQAQTVNALSGSQKSRFIRKGESRGQFDREFSQSHPYDPERVPHHV